MQGVSRIRVLSLSEDGPLLLGSVVRLFDQGSVADAEVGGCVQGFRRPQRQASVFWRLLCVVVFYGILTRFSFSRAVPAAQELCSAAQELCSAAQGLVQWRRAGVQYSKGYF